MKKKKELVKTKNVSGVIKVSQNIGDSLTNEYNETKDLKVALTALSAYKTAINGAKAQVVYKKLTGNPSKIKFFED